MNNEALRKFCLSLPYTVEDVKWEADLCFTMVGKMYCVTGLEGAFGVSFKCNDEDFTRLIEHPAIIPAPYLARNKWVKVNQPGALSKSEWEQLLRLSYKLVASKLPAKTKREFGL